MIKVTAGLLILALALPAQAERARRGPVKSEPRSGARAVRALPSPVSLASEVASPAADDPDRAEILRLQEALAQIVRGRVLGRLHVGMQVQDLASGRTLFGWRSAALMDPASNQKLLATATALLRLGGTFRYRTEVTGPLPDADGRIDGDIVIRGEGDPSLRARHLDDMAQSLAAQGVTTIAGSILADPRPIGSAEEGGRPSLRVGSAFIEVQVRPSDKIGGRPLLSLRPATDAITLVNLAETRAKGRSRLAATIARTGSQIQVIVKGRIAQDHGPVVLERPAPSHALFTAILLRQALVQAGISVSGNAGLYGGHAPVPMAACPPLSGVALALGSAPAADSAALLPRQASCGQGILARHASEPLALLLRRVNKSSDNEWAERMLETVAAEANGGAPSPDQGARVVREALAELGLARAAYLPVNGSGLGHHNRVTASGMIALLRRLYFDPRLGPEIIQSLSVGGVDGTTRNRFRGSPAAHRVRAKTGTLNGVSCLSGFVGDGSEILAFSILVEGHRHRALASVRAAQVGAVDAMMRFAARSAPKSAKGASGLLEGAPGADFETGHDAEDPSEGGGEGESESDGNGR